MTSWTRRFDDVGMGDPPPVGGKNASLGEMRRAADGLFARRIRARVRAEVELNVWHEGGLSMKGELS
jgi:hypothetical protein